MATRNLLLVFNFTLCWVLACSLLQGSNSSTHGDTGSMNNIGSNNGSSTSSANSTGRNNRGRGTHTGSGSSTGNGSLPPCTVCFGHGVNPTMDPRCKIGCRGSGRVTGAGAATTLLPSTVNQLAFANMGSDSEGACSGRDCHSPRNLKRIGSVIEQNVETTKTKGANNKFKLWIGMGGVIVMLVVLLVISAYFRMAWKKRQTRVGVLIDTGTGEIEMKGIENI